MTIKCTFLIKLAINFHKSSMYMYAIDMLEYLPCTSTNVCLFCLNDVNLPYFNDSQNKYATTLIYVKVCIKHITKKSNFLKPFQF